MDNIKGNIKENSNDGKSKGVGEIKRKKRFQGSADNKKGAEAQKKKKSEGMNRKEGRQKIKRWGKQWMRRSRDNIKVSCEQ